MRAERISNTCEVLADFTTERVCGEPATVCYAAMGGGWFAMCPEHGAKHASITMPIADVRRIGRAGYDCELVTRRAKNRSAALSAFKEHVTAAARQQQEDTDSRKPVR